MKFNKIVTIGISDASLDASYWKRIDSLAAKRVSLAKDSADINKQLADADCVLVNPFAFKMEKDVIDAAPKLKYVGVLATAFAKVDVEHAKKKGVVVTNIPGYSTESVAEFVFAALLESVRELERGKRQAREGNYSEAGFSPIEIRGKKFGVLGLGRIGSRVAELALGFGADASYWSRNRKKELERKGVKYEDADALIHGSDVLSLHLALAKDTERFLDKKRIQRLKSGAIVLNMAPMELVDVSALDERLARGDITFILDHSDEMAAEDVRKLSRHKNCVIYPPIAYVTKEARVAKQDIFVGNIKSFLKGKPNNTV